MFNDQFTAQSEKICRIIGHIEDEGLVTLDDCFYINRSLAFGGISRSKVFAHRVFCGVAYEQNEIVTFNSLSFSVDCLDEWIAISGINIDYSDDYKTATIGYLPPENLKYELENGMMLEVFFSYKLPGFSRTTEATISQRAYFKLSSSELLPYTDFTSIAFKLTNFLCFAMDDTVSLKNLIGKSSELVEQMSQTESHQIPIKIYYQSIPFEEKEPTKSWHNMLFSFGLIKENAGSVINKWIAAYEVITPALNLCFSTKNGAHKYLDGNFLALAQGLETYHRRTSTEKLMDQREYDELIGTIIDGCPEKHRDWLKGRVMHGNEINLGKRLKYIVEPFKEQLGSSKERSKLLRKIVDTRNYLTHYNETLETNAASSSELFNVCQKMEAIFQLHFLKVIGFNDSEIASVIENCYPLRRKLKEI
ncbi:hypothetical protein P3I65_004681 [Vibrio alginolyticus]|nr:hypothetical protein [Vibrio alginolyticus]